MKAQQSGPRIGHGLKSLKKVRVLAKPVKK